MAIFFDSSTLISLATTCNLQWLGKLKKAYGGEFFITPAVKAETIERGLNSLRFRYEAMRLKYLLDTGVFKLYESNVTSETNNLLNLINSTYTADGRPLRIVQLGEMTALAGALAEKAHALAVDERTTRILIENPEALRDLLSKKLHTKINIDENSMYDWEKLVSDKFEVIRSAELAFVAWKKSLLIDQSENSLAGILWALKFAGCAISESEINLYIKKFALGHGQ